MSLQESYNEAALLQQVAGGNEKAFRSLFDAHHQKLGSYVLRLTNSFPLTEEIVQDVFIKIWVQRTELTNVRQFDAWLFVVARNHAFNYLKQLARKHKREKEWVRSNIEEAVVQDKEEDGYPGSTTIINQAIMLLPSQQQKVYRLSREEGLSREQIATQLGISLETAKKHMVLALRFIRQYVTTHYKPFLFLLSSYLARK